MYTIVYSTYGNHMRTTPAKKDSIHEDNMERIIPWWLAERFKTAQNIKVAKDSGDEFIKLYVCGYNVLAVHGDLDANKNAPMLLNALHGKVYGQGIDYLLSAHMHHSASTESLGIEHIQTGCLCGTDEYAKTHRLYSTPCQSLMIFTPEFGLDMLCNIKFGNRKKAP